MKKVVISLLSIALVFVVVSATFAVPLSYRYTNSNSEGINTQGSVPDDWFRLYFPDSSSGTYSNGPFEYDDYVNNVESFKITLFGHDDNTNGYPINIFLSFNYEHDDYVQVASYDVPQNVDFTLALDIKNNNLLYNGVDVGDLNNVSLASFVGFDRFWVGYGCDFEHDKTRVDLTVNPAAPVPEPATMLLLGSGLIGVGAFVRRKFKR